MFHPKSGNQKFVWMLHYYIYWSNIQTNQLPFVLISKNLYWKLRKKKKKNLIGQHLSLNKSRAPDIAVHQWEKILHCNINSIDFSVCLEQTWKSRGAEQPADLKSHGRLISQDIFHVKKPSCWLCGQENLFKCVYLLINTVYNRMTWKKI